MQVDIQRLFLQKEYEYNQNGPVGAGYGAGGTIWDEKGRDQVAGFLIFYQTDMAVLTMDLTTI